MSLSYASAVDWANARSQADEPRLGMLEAVAFQQFPEVVATFGSDGAAVAQLLARRRAGSAWSVADVVRTVSLLMVVGGVLVGWGTMAAASYLFERMDAATSVPIASWAFAIAAVGFMATILGWAIDGAPRSKGILNASIVALIASTLGLVTLFNVSANDAYPLSTFAMISIGATVALAAIFVLLILVWGKPVVAPDSPSADGLRVMASERDRAMRAVQSIPDAERARIRDDRDAALSVLLERNLIDHEWFQRACDAPLGSLFVLDADRKGSA